MQNIENLYMQYKKDVYGYLISLTCNPSLSEDLLSETFLKAIRSLQGFKHNSSVKTWLFAIARNLWYQHLRASKPQVEYNDLLEIYISEGIDDNYLKKETLNRVRELLTTKDERTRKIIAMRIEGISFSEIAEQIGISESSARVIDFRTKKWLRSILEREGLI